MISKTRSAGGDVVFLTVLGALSQGLGFAYRVALSRMVGAQVMGLYQLLMPVYSVLLSLTSVGMTAAASNLTARQLARGDRRGAAQTRNTCLLLFFLLLLPLAAVVVLGSDAISVRLLGDARTQLGLILLLPCVALTGVENIHKHIFFGAGRVRAPAVSELVEQLVRAAAVLGLLAAFLPQHPERAAGLIIAGMALCEVWSACTLTLLYRRWLRRTGCSGPGESARRRLGHIAAIALPVAGNALLNHLLSAANATLIPRMLVAGGATQAAATARFGVLAGMTLPMLALPTVFLGALNLVLTPSLARAAALDRKEELRRLIGRALSSVSRLELPALGLLVVLGPDLGWVLFHQRAVGDYLLPLALTMAAGCWTSVLAAALNGVGRQTGVALISLTGGGVQLLFTLTLVPRLGLGGYVLGALVSGGWELILCLGLTIRCTGLRLRLHAWLLGPALAALLAALTGNLLRRTLLLRGVPLLPADGAAAVFVWLLYLAALEAQGLSLRGVLRLEE